MLRSSHLLAAFCVATFQPAAHAHGGQYRGPSDTAPREASTGASAQTTGSGDGSTPTEGPSSASAPAAPGASSASQASSGTAGLGGSTRGATLSDDLTRWEFWWEFGKDPFLRLRDAVDPRRLGGADDALLNPRFALRHRNIVPPTEDDRRHVAETLAVVLRQAKDRDTVSACLVALAKIGRDGAGWDLHGAFLPFLARNDQEQRETAALAFGIAGQGGPSLDLLIDLMRNGDVGRKASGNTAVNVRTRAFAAYGLGLVLRRQQSPAAGHRIVEALRGVLLAPEAESRDLKVAAIEALSLLPRDWPGAAAQSLRHGIVDDLGAYYRKDLGPGEQLVQAHVPPAISRLLSPTAERAATWKATFAADLARGIDTQAAPDSQAKNNPHMAQSCALALGGLCLPWNADTDADAAICQVLVRCYRGHRDHLTRSFALLSLARLGGTRSRDILLAELATASRAIEQPWCAIALGVWAARAREASGVATAHDADPAVTTELRRVFAAAKTPAALGALGLALGLAQDLDSGGALRTALQANAHRDDLAGYLALGLGLMNDPLATGEIRALLATADRRPHLMLQTVRALGLLGDIGVVDDLCQQLDTREPSLVRLSAVASALGQIGDRRSLTPLLEMLQNQRLTPLTRAFAAVALGMVCDKDPLPWNSAYATNCNYQAATETLTDGASGILDIL